MDQIREGIIKPRNEQGKSSFKLPMKYFLFKKIQKSCDCMPLDITKTYFNLEALI
jgi:hypothetical protein